jgi:hypothetical protein
MRQRLRRGNPTLGEAVIEKLLQAWLCERPGARLSDAVGVRPEWPRSAP